MAQPPPIPQAVEPVRALVVSGGGSKGQYAVGAVGHLLGELELEFHIYAGVSVGALIAAFLAQFKSGQEREAADALQALFTPIENKDIWKRWLFGYLAGALWRSSFKNSKPLEKLVVRHLDVEKIRVSGKALRVGAVSLTSGEYQVFDQHYESLAAAVYSSAAFPAMFRPGKHGNQLWTDGGVRTVTPLKAAIDAGATHVVYITLAPPCVEHGFEKDPESPDVAFRSIELMSDQITNDDIKIAQLYNELAGSPGYQHKRKVKITAIRPESAINPDSLDFVPAQAVVAQHRGYQDAVAAMSKARGVL